RRPSTSATGSRSPGDRSANALPRRCARHARVRAARIGARRPSHTIANGFLRPSWMSAMKTGSSILFVSALVAAVAGSSLRAVTLDSGPRAAGSAAEDRSGPTGSAQDTTLSAYRNELLDLALRAASALPVDPHIKTRCRLQGAVAAACIELDQPHKALDCLE